MNHQNPETVRKLLAQSRVIVVPRVDPSNQSTTFDLYIEEGERVFHRHYLPIISGVPPSTTTVLRLFERERDWDEIKLKDSL